MLGSKANDERRHRGRHRSGDFAWPYRAATGLADGLTGGVVGVLCCVGPTVLALLGIVSAGTAFAWATTLYDNDAWWFRLGGLAVLALLVWVSLRRRDQCSVAGVRRWRWRLLGVLGIAVGTYLALYALTTWLGSLA